MVILKTHLQLKYKSIEITSLKKDKTKKRNKIQMKKVHQRLNLVNHLVVPTVNQVKKKKRNL